MAYHPPVPVSAPGSASGSSSISGLHFFSYPFGDTTYTKVFVGGLAWETQSETLQRHFEQFGEILEAVVISDKSTGRSKGYGFVTFRLPESASRACANPSPVIDGRRANCNLASLGRPRPAPPYAHLRLHATYDSGVSIPRPAYIGGSTYHEAVPYNFQQAISYPSFGYSTYGPEYAYPQNMYGPFMGQHYVQVYGISGGAVNTAIYPYGQMGQPISTAQGFATMQGYTAPGHNIMQLGDPTMNGYTASTCPAIQAPFAGVAIPVPAQPQLFLPAHSQFTQGSGSEHAAN